MKENVTAAAKPDKYPTNILAKLLTSETINIINIINETIDKEDDIAHNNPEITYKNI